MPTTRRSTVVSMRTTRRTLLTTAVGGALVALTGCQPAAGSPRPTPPPIKVSLNFPGPGVVFIPLEVAISKGFFAQQGISVDASYARGGPQVIAAIQSKSLDFIGTTIDLQLAALQEANAKPLTMVTSITKVPPFAIVARKGTADLKALAGQPFGVFNLGSGDQVIAEYLLRKGGVDPKTVKYVPLGSDDAKIAALAKGDVAGVVVGEPARTILAGRGMPTLVNLFDPAQAQRYFPAGYQFTGLVTRPDVIAQKADLVQRMVNATIQGDVFVAKQTGSDIAGAVRDVAVVGGDRKTFGAVMEKVKGNLFSPDGKIEPKDVDQVKTIQQNSGILSPAASAVETTSLYTNRFVDVYWKANSR